MHVHYSNNVINILRITETHTLTCYRPRMKQSAARVVDAPLGRACSRTPESTPGEVTRIRYPVDRTTYLENFLCQTNKPSVLFEISYLLLFPSGDNSVPHTQINTNYHINRKKTFHFKTYRLFMFGIFTSVQIPPEGPDHDFLFFSREQIFGGEWYSDMVLVLKVLFACPPPYTF